MSRCNGGVAERLKATVLKTVDGQLSVSSNLTSSAISNTKPLIFKGFFSPAVLGIQVGIQVCGRKKSTFLKFTAIVINLVV